MNRETDDRVLQIIGKILSAHGADSTVKMDTVLWDGTAGADEIDFVYIIVELQDTFGIHFIPEDFEGYALNTPGNIAACVRRHLEKET